MSLLRELEAKARHSTARRAADEAAARAQAQQDSKRAGALVDRVERHLRRMASALAAVDDPIEVSYTVLDLGELPQLFQRDYQVARDPERPDGVRFAFQCAGELPLKAVLASEALARSKESACVEAGLGCRRVAYRGQRRALVIEPRVPVSLAFRPAGASLELRSRNLFDVGTRRYLLAAERVDDELLEALLEVIMRRGNRIGELTGDRVSDAERVRLQRELARSERRRKAELGGFFTRSCFPITEGLRRLLLRQ